MALADSTVAWARRRQWWFAYEVVLAGTAVAITATFADGAVVTAREHWQFWVMAIVAQVAAWFAFIATPSGLRTPTIVCPTICFTFAIELCWGLGPAIVAQLVAVALVAWRLRRPIYEAIEAAGQYALSFAAASLVLWVGQPDPFERNGPTNLLTDALSVVGAAGAWMGTFGLLVFLSARLSASPVRSRDAARSLSSTVLFKAALLLLSPVLAVTAHINIGFVPLIFIPLYAVQRMARLSAERDQAAQTDPLTGLANRTRLKLEFEDLVAGYRTPDRARASLLLLDLNSFKDVNDALGHDVGDQVLVAVAQRLGETVPADATVARLGGDEFAILVARAADEAAALAHEVAAALAAPVRLDRLRIDVTASIGIGRHDRAADGFTELLRHADLAMYDAKRRDDSVQVYADGPAGAGSERLSMLADFRDALESGDRTQLGFVYQPQVSLLTGEVEGVEALLRWRHPLHGEIPTGELLGLVERSSVMPLLTARVIDDVIAQVGRWAAAGLRLRASLNISARDLYGDDVVTRLAACLAEHAVAPDQIQIEITESALLTDPTRARATVGRIAALGVALSLDDFGTGYSSLQHLRKMPITEIKIDRTFVAGMADNRDDAAIVRSTVEMARMLGIRTVAEGLENEYTRQLLVAAGCDLAQGWLTARPMQGHAVPEFVSSCRIDGSSTYPGAVHTAGVHTDGAHTAGVHTAGAEVAGVSR